MCLFQLWCLIVNYQSGLDLRWDICSWKSSPGRGQMSGGEETKGLNLKEQQEKRKRRWEGGKKKKNQRLSAFGSVIWSLQTKWAGRALNLPRVCRQRAPSKAPTCCSGVPGTAAAPLDPARDAPGAPRKSCSVSFSSQTPEFSSLPRFVSGRWAANNEELLPNDSCHGRLERQRWSWHKSKHSHG